MRLVTTVLAFMLTFGSAHAVTPQTSWADSYSANGSCYIDSTFDHGAGDLVVQTLNGPLTVRQIAALIGPGPGKDGNPLYNDVQCGNGPANNAGDEDFDQCPGRVDLGEAGCSEIGPRWSFAPAQPTDPVDPIDPGDSEGAPVLFSGPNAKSDIYAELGPDAKVDCDPIDGVLTCANYRLGSGAPDGVPDLADLSGPVTPVEPTDPVEPPVVITNLARLVAGANAKAELIADVGNVPIDCDRIGGVLTCANYQLGSAAPDGVPTLAQLESGQIPDPSNPPIVSPPTAGSFVVEMESADAPNSNWIKRSQSLEYVGDNRYTTPTGAVITYNVIFPATGVWQMSVRARATRETFENGQKRSDLHNDAWWRMNGGDVSGYTSWRSFVKVFLSGSGDWAGPGTIDVHNEPRTRLRQSFIAGQTYQLQLSGRSNFHEIDKVTFEQVSSTAPAPVDTSVPNSVYRDGDLVSLHYDSSFDYDDEQAKVAARHVLDDFPDVDFIVVSNTKSDENSGVLQGAHAHTLTLFPDAFDALRSSDLASVASSWQITLASGGTVHVAEGGPSDYTANVIRELQRRGVQNLKRIRVIQHSAGTAFNERKTSDANIALVKSVATYVAIANGNAGGNASADLNAGNGSEAQTFESRALNTQYEDQWRTAIAYAGNSARRIDFSDTVELLHILGEPNDGNTVTFADRYF